MTITLNGQPHQIEAGTTVAQLIKALGMPEHGVAVAIDRQVVPRSSHASVVLEAESRVEVIRAVGGG